MRICYVLTSLGMGGAERLTLAMAARMAERGHEVEVVVLRRLDEEWTTSLALRHLGLRKTPWSAIQGFARARRLMRVFRPDLIHSHGFHANLFARALRVLDPRPASIATVHNVYEGGRLRMTAYRLSDGLSTRTTAVSQAAANRFMRMKAVSAKRCVVVANAIEIAEYAPDGQRRAAMREAMRAGEDFVWLAAGRITAAKDYPNLLRAFQNTHATMPRSRLWIAGENRVGEEEPLRRLAGELGISECVCWLGLRRDLPALLDAADGFVLSSAWEGMPLVLAEAMAMEKPVVATDVGGVRELVGETGGVVAAGDAEALAQAMQGVMRESPLTREARGRRARQRIQELFSMEARAAEWERLYAQAVAENS